MTARRRVMPSRPGFARVALACAVMAAAPLAASARPTATVEAPSVVFFSDTLAVVARGGAALVLADGTRAHADAAYVDLKSNRVVLAGHARITRGDAAAGADAVALELEGRDVDLLDAASGVRRTTRALGAAAPAEFDAQRFAFPEVDDRDAFIKSKRAAITPRADVRFTPAAFPTSVGGVPVPSYLYTYSTGAGFASNSLPGATFDQPYGLWGSQTSLTALHARWEDGPGAALALQQQIVSGDEAYVAAAFDLPLRGTSVRSFNAYRRMGARYTLVADGTSTIYQTVTHVGMTAAFGAAGGRVDYARGSGGGSTFDASLRTPDRPLIGGATWRLRGDVGFDAQRGGLISQVPDRAHYSTVWRHGLDLFVASPVVHVPFNATLSATFDAARTWYAFPHHYDTLSGSATLSRPLTRTLTLFAGYQALWSADVYPNAQAVFYPTPLTPLLTPDGTPYLGYSAYTGARTFRTQNADLQYTPEPNTSLRLSVIHTGDFPQFNGYPFDRPAWEVRGEARFRPFRNVGLDVGRAYDFGWGGRRWVPRWTFAITP
ncbi:MAG TPA: hypothetical protein VGC96_13080 [Candidatus Elarobacter sp.]